MSFRERVLSVFPIPNSLALLSAGVDISSGSIKCAQFSRSGSMLELSVHNETPLPEGVVVDGDIENPQKVVDVLRSFRLRNGIKSAHACLPEKKAYLYQTLIPNGTKDIREAIEAELESHVPLPPSETLFDFEIIRTVGTGTVVSVTAYAKRVVNEYAAAFEAAGVMLRSLEVESQALARAVVSQKKKDHATMIIDFGRNTTRVAIADGGVVAFTATIDVGGATLTTAVMKHFGVSEEEAEKLKNEWGFLMNKENKEVVTALMTTLSVVRDEVVKHFSYWNTVGDSDVPRKSITEVVLCGGNANLKGLPEYFGASISAPVSVADVWQNAFSLDMHIPALPFQESLEFATAIGLALRGAHTNIW